MTITTFLDRWVAAGAMTGEEYRTLGALARRERISVYLELHALLYLGVVAFVGGLGWTVHTYFTKLGDAAILVPLTAALSACLWYAFDRGAAYSSEQVESPSFAFDYVLYLACLMFAVELGYVEFRFHLLQENWDGYLLASAAVYFALAYRFDNRFVLSLALSSLGGWFGVRISYFGLHLGIREYALAYGVVVAAAGVSLTRRVVKPHFLDTYLHVAANAVLSALVSGAMLANGEVAWLFGLVAACGVAIERGVRCRRFAFVLYGVIYGYIGVSARMLRAINGDKASLTYIVISGIAVVAALVVVSRRFGRED